MVANLVGGLSVTIIPLVIFQKLMPLTVRTSLLL